MVGLYGPFMHLHVFPHMKWAGEAGLRARALGASRGLLAVVGQQKGRLVGGLLWVAMMGLALVRAASQRIRAECYYVLPYPLV